MSEEKPEHLWVNGVVAVRDGKPYIQLSNENGMLAQLDLASARQYADDIVQMCARTEMDAMFLDFMQDKVGMAKEDGARMLQTFRDYRADLDAARPRENGGPDRE